MRLAFSILIVSAMLAASAARAGELVAEAPESDKPCGQAPEPEFVPASLAPEMLLPGAVPVEPSPKGDPMATDFQFDCCRERLRREMEQAHRNGRAEDALSNACLLAVNFPGTRDAKKAATIMEFYEKEIIYCFEEEGCPVPAFPPWVSSNTRAIIYDKGGSLIQVGFDFYAEGQSIRDYPNVFVEKIEPDNVIYRLENEYASKTYSVTIPDE